ncbi:MAG: TetR/AcrR family transcriptional regulator [Candidatus Cyclobacteriaceae bacterium M3_2C_046]
MPIQKIDKQEIIFKAYQIFRTKGYHHTSLSDIGQACGIFKSGIYHYFPDKETILKEVLWAVKGYFKEHVLSILSKSDLDPVQRLDKFFNQTTKFFFGEEGGCIFSNIGLETADSNPVFREIIAIYFNDWMDALYQIFLEKYEPVSARELATFSLQDLKGSLLLARIFQDQDYYIRTTQRIRSYFLTDY